MEVQGMMEFDDDRFLGVGEEGCTMYPNVSCTSFNAATEPVR